MPATHRLCILLSVLAVGCGDKDGTSSDTGTTGGSDSGSADADPVYGVISVPTSTDGTTLSYLVFSDSLTGGFGLEGAVAEFSGRAVAGSPAGSDQIFIGTSDSGELTRYDYVDGTIQESGKVNFAAQEVTAFSGYSSQFHFVDDDTAYWFDRSGRIVIWNPSAMTVDDSILVPEMLREDPDNPGTNYTTSVTGAPVVDGDTVYSFVSWDSRASGVITVPGLSGLLIVDTATDTAEFIVDDAGCGYGRDGVIDGEWLYIATEAVGTAVHHLSADNGPAPCLRRFNTSTRTFDDDYTIDLNELGGGPTGSLVVTADGEALLHVLDAELAAPQIADDTLSNPRSLSSAELWHTARLTVGDTPSLEVLDVPLRSASTLPVTLGALRVTPTFGEVPEILEVTADGILATDQTGAEVTGFTSAVFQVR